MRSSKALVCAITAALGLAGAARAQDLKSRVDALEKTVQDQQKSLAAITGINIHAFAAVDYIYNINTPSPQDRGNALVLFDEDANSFTLNQGNIHLDRSDKDGQIGFLVDLDFGKTAEIVGRSTRWDNSFEAGTSSESNNQFEARQFYLSYKIPVLDGITLKAGKFVTLAGAEVIKSYNSFNYTVSNSILFGFAIPFTHTGLMASAPLGDMFAIDLGLVNGWDDVVDNNSGKSLHGGLTFAPIKEFSLYVTGTYGPEQYQNASSNRALMTLLATVKPIDQLTLLLDFDWANESNCVPVGGLGGVSGCVKGAPNSALWYGVAGYVIGQVTDELSLTLRGEVFDDSDGSRTGTPQTVWEFTPSAAYKITDALTARAEYRHDESNKQFFNHDGVNFVRGQDTLAAELIYAF